MKKADFIAAVAEKSGLSKKDATAAVSAVFGTLGDVLAAGDSFSELGFGTFSVVAKPEREGRNPRTGEKTKIAASKAVKFKAGKALKDKVNA